MILSGGVVLGVTVTVGVGVIEGVLDILIEGVGVGEAQAAHASTANPYACPANSSGRLNNCTWNFLEFPLCLNQK